MRFHLSSCLIILAASSPLLTACGPSVPAPVSAYAATLPGRNANQYATIIPELRGELVLQDAAVACSVAIADGKKEAEAPACVCSHSDQATWQTRCQPWFATASGAGVTATTAGRN
jgi:hypothetical protein